MSTPILSKHRLAGALGDLLVDVRTGDRHNPRPAVLIIHGFKGFKDWGMFPVVAERLARAGFTAASFNLSGSGVDDGGDFSLADNFARNTYSAELDDVTRMVAALRAGTPLGIAPPPSIGLLGHSRGGGMAILAAARDPGIGALVTWAAIGTIDRWSDEAKASWRRRGHLNIQNTRTGQVLPMGTAILDDIAEHAGGALDILAAAGRIETPWLILHGESDESVPVDDARMLADASRRSSTRLLLVPSGHTFGATHPLTGMPETLDRVMGETVGWFSRHLT
ncbi:MAG TPA: alpha/beta fold hydrolase [Gemmatimonadales bacterium]|nr:alpha/beta fold hydrolase [Gemmatimonadales bacterium]